MLLYSLFWAIPFVNLVLNRMVVSVPVPRSLSFSFYSLAMADIRDGHLASAEVHLSKCVQYDPEDTEVLQLLGVIKFKLGNSSVAIQLLRRANELLNYQDLYIVSNLVEILRSSGELQKASEVGHEALRVVGLNREQDCAGLFINLGIVEAARHNLFLAENLFRRAARVEPASLRAWQLYADIVLKRSGLEAEDILRDGILVHPEDFSLHFMLGTSLQVQQKYAAALNTYLRAEAINDNDCQLQVNIASTYQSMGLVKEAEQYYMLALPHCPEDAGLFNNYAALLGVLGRDHEQYLWLHKALDISPFLITALSNLAGYYQDEGNLASARELLHRAAFPRAAAAVGHTLELTSISADILNLRTALMLSPICASWPQMWEERVNITRNLQALMDASSAPVHPSNILPSEVDSFMERIHFYISYHGLNDRSLQDLIMDVYRLYLRIEYFSPYLRDLPHESFPRWITPPPAASIDGIAGVVTKRRARIGFISKFLGIFEPHGMLLDGVMRYLPREHFEVIALAVTRDDVTPLSPTVTAACDEVHTVSLTYSHAQAMLQKLRLDVLVFADTLSEPMTHFLAHSRLAPIQMAFWGNPITSGSQQIDFFVSADVMEHPHRTRMPIADEPYTEQVVLMEGQGIWYLRPDIARDLASSNLTHLVAAPRTFSRTDFGLQEDCFLYALPQSTFKIHPLYDLVLRDILERAPDSHLVVTGGRRPRWTEIYITRLQSALGPELSQRLHVIERVSSEQFLALLEISDVILHPFPFDGSKTSADALRVHKPLVALPTEYLRGRMGAAFMRSINLPELVARNRSEYVDIAVRLKSNRGFYQQMVGLIAEREDLIWEDMTVPFTWSNLLSGIIGVSALEWEEFLAQTGRDVALEKQRTLARERNAALFQQRWGKEAWLLRDAVAALETMLDSADQQPCIFLDWNCAD